MRILVTNDDGITSEGLHVLARTIAGAGHDVTIVAPSSDRSGVGAALGLVHADQHLDAERVDVPGCAGIPAYALDGPPGMCTVAARLGAFGPPPELVVSGINAGLNTGRAILHSGTVGAALTAQNFGCSGLAVSVAPRDGVWLWDTAARLALELLGQLAEAPPRTVLNLNVPGVEPHELRGLRWARLAAFGAVRAAIADAGDGKLQFELRATGASPPPDSDQGLCDAGFATVTTITGIAEAWPPDGAAEDPELDVDGLIDVGEVVVPGAPFEAVHMIPDASQPHYLHRPLAAPSIVDIEPAPSPQQ
jgi:5'-nucleotidase